MFHRLIPGSSYEENDISFMHTTLVEGEKGEDSRLLRKIFLFHILCNYFLHIFHKFFEVYICHAHYIVLKFYLLPENYNYFMFIRFLTS